MAIFHSYVKLPEGTHGDLLIPHRNGQQRSPAARGTTPRPASNHWRLDKMRKEGCGGHLCFSITICHMFTSLWKITMLFMGKHTIFTSYVTNFQRATLFSCWPFFSWILISEACFFSGKAWNADGLTSQRSGTPSVLQHDSKKLSYWSYGPVEIVEIYPLKIMYVFFRAMLNYQRVEI